MKEKDLIDIDAALKYHIGKTLKHPERFNWYIFYRDMWPFIVSHGLKKFSDVINYKYLWLTPVPKKNNDEKELQKI